MTYQPETTGVADGRGQLGIAHPLHTTLHNGY